jgi:hypothetical protein
MRPRQQRTPATTGLTLDAGALIAVDRADKYALALLETAHHAGEALFIPAAALAQAWRDGKRQARLAAFVRSIGPVVVPLDAVAARTAGQLCGRAGTSDVVDASIVVCAYRRGRRIVTSDPNDLAKLDPHASLLTV